MTDDKSEKQVEHIDAIDYVKDAIVSGELARTQEAVARLKGRMEQFEIDQITTNGAMKRTAIVVHSLARVLEEEKEVIEATPEPIKTILLDLKLAIDTADHSLSGFGL